MIIDILLALLLASVPVAAFTYLVFDWSVATGRLRPFEGDKDLQKQFKEHRKTRKAERKQERAAKKAGKTKKPKSDKPLFHKDTGWDLLHSKLMFFGGGFYGTMALLAYAVVEIEEIFGFLAIVFEPGRWFANLGFDLIIQFIINSVMNLVAAFVWFKTLGDYVPYGNAFVWIGAAYFGYVVALHSVGAPGDGVQARFTTGLKTTLEQARDWTLSTLGLGGDKTKH